MNKLFRILSYWVVSSVEIVFCLSNTVLASTRKLWYTPVIAIASLLIAIIAGVTTTAHLVIGLLGLVLLLGSGAVQSAFRFVSVYHRLRQLDYYILRFNNKSFSEVNRIIRRKTNGRDSSFVSLFRLSILESTYKKLLDDDMQEDILNCADYYSIVLRGMNHGQG